jgi:hypothetical protein
MDYPVEMLEPPPIALRVAQSRARMAVLDRTYKRDSKGRFGSGGSSLTEAEFDALPTGQDALDALPGTYRQVIDQARGARPSKLSGRDAVRLADAVDGEHGYARDGYIDTNRALYEAHGGSLAGATDHTRQQVADVDQLMELSGPTTSDIAVHRGTSEPSRVIPGFNPNGDNTGRTWTHHAYESTSARHEIAEEFARGHNASRQHRSDENHPTAIRIHVPAGTRALQLTTMDRYEGEGDGTGYAEVALPRGLTHRIVRDHGVVGGVHYLDAEVVSDDG